MSYNQITDFVAILRQLGSGVEFARMPGLDYVVAAMARAGLFKLYVGQTAPIANQSTIVWLMPALPSWTAEGTVFLWNSATAEYELATLSLWNQLLSPSQYVFQSAVGASNVVNANTSLLAIQRAAPVSTALILPGLATRSTKPLQIVDWSTGVALHSIALTAADGATIMKQAAWNLQSTPDQLSGITLRPSAELNGWVITP